MERLVRVFLFVAVALAAARGAQAQVNLATAGPGGTAFAWSGTRVNARAGAVLARVEVSGDVNRPDLLVGAPGSGPSGQGQVFIEFMGPGHTGTLSLSTTDVIITGEAAGDRFGASISGGLIARSRDVIVGAPSAFGGKGAVYLFPGTFTGGGETRSAATHALLKVIGAPGDQLGASIVASDLDGDGFRDIIMAAPGSGNVYVVFGGPGLSGTVDLSLRPSFVVAMTIGSPATLTLASADFNNDGRFKDLAIGVPGWSGGVGAVFFLLGRAQGTFPASFPGAPFSLLASANGSVVGATAADRAGTALQVSDFDGDGRSDLVIGAPGAGGPANSRPGAGAAYILWGGPQFTTPRNLAAADVIIHGAASGDQLGTAITQGAIRRDLRPDLALLAPGASAKGDIDIVYGGLRSTIPKVIDLAGGISRVLRADPAGAPLESLVALEVTGEGAEDIVAGAPGATVGANANAGLLYNVYSPTIWPSPLVTSVTYAQGPSRTVTLQMQNIGTTTTRWAVRSNSSWMTISPTSGTSSASAPGTITLTLSPGALAANQTYEGGFSLVSLDHDLVWATSANVNMTVTPGTPTGPIAPRNPFGVPDPPDEGSPDGVFTPAGANVSVLPVRDVLVTFANVITPGQTKVDITRSTQTDGGGVNWGPWNYRITTTAVFSGAVTLGVAYEPALVASGVRAIRVLSSGIALATQRVDTTNRYVIAVGASLPATVTIQNSSRIDLSDDGNADFLWQRKTNAALSAWFMQGTTRLSVNTVNSNGIADPSWKIIGTADFDRDGYADFLWRHDGTGTFGVWFMRGTVLRARAMLNPSGFADTSWKVVALADFDRDGYPDLLWRHDLTGTFGVWFMQGTELRARAMLSPTGIPDTNWKVVGVGDFDADGKPDLVWRNELTGAAGVWCMEGTTLRMAMMLNPPGIADANWLIEGVGDLDGDNRPDIVFHHRLSGALGVWLMNGFNVAASVALPSIDPSWRLVGIR